MVNLSVFEQTLSSADICIYVHNYTYILKSHDIIMAINLEKQNKLILKHQDQWHQQGYAM